MATVVDIRCVNCGAHVDREGARFCNFCGAKLPTVHTSGVPTTLPADALRARFDALLDHEALPELMEYDPGPLKTSAALSPITIGFATATAFLFAMLFVAVALHEESPILGKVLGAVVIPCAILVYHFAKNACTGTEEPKRPKVHRHPVLVADERTKVTGGGNSAARTQYFVTLQSREGERAEYRVQEALAAYVTKGDMGVAYIHRGHLISFRRISI